MVGLRHSGGLGGSGDGASRGGDAIRLEALEDEWMAKSSLPLKLKLMRRVMGKAAGLAGECLANAFDPDGSLIGADKDIGQIGGALQAMGLMGSVGRVPPNVVLTIVRDAIALLQQHRPAFDELRRRLYNERRVEAPVLPANGPLRMPEEDERLFEEMRALLQA